MCTEIFTRSFLELLCCITCADTMAYLIENAEDSNHAWLIAAIEEDFIKFKQKIQV